jgi:hypothetical protein
MTIQPNRAMLPGLTAGAAFGALLLAAASHGHAAPRAGGAAVKPPVLILPVGKVSTFGTVNRAPKSIKPPPGVNVRDHRGGKQTSTSTSQGGVLVDGTEGKVRRPPSCGRGGLCGHDPKSIVRDHRPPKSPRGEFGRGGKP